MANQKINTTVTLVTFGLFMSEALLHYNLGVHKDSAEKKFVLPPAKDFVKLAAIVGVFSLANGYLISVLSK